MSQPIQPQYRDRILRNPQVHSATPCHVILKNGQVLDPGEFVMELRPVFFVMKLVECGCFFKGHKLGLHVIVSGHVKVFGTGREENAPPIPTICPKGRWVIEEVVPA